MKYIFKNIILFIKQERLIFILTILCIICSSIIINFSFGLYQEYNHQKIDAEYGVNRIVIQVNNTETRHITKGMLVDFSLNLDEETNNNCTCIATCGLINEDQFMLQYMVRDNKIVMSDEVAVNMVKNKFIVSGKYFSEEQFNNGELVALGEARFFNINGEYEKNDESTKYLTDDGHYLINGKEYTCIGYSDYTFAPLVPITTLDDDVAIYYIIEMFFTNPITRKQYEDISNNVDIYFSDLAQMPELDIPDVDSTRFYNTIIIISIMISIISAIIFAILYKYILIQRRKSLTIFRLCGASRNKVILYYLCECMIISIPVYIISVFIYDIVMRKYLTLFYTYIEEAYNIRTYSIIFIIYIIISLIVLGIMINKNISKKTLSYLKGGDWYDI